MTKIVWQFGLRAFLDGKMKEKNDEIPTTYFQSLIDQDLSNCFAQKPTDWQGVLQAATSGQNVLHETLKANPVN
jgi:hypothetical protein